MNTKTIHTLTMIRINSIHIKHYIIPGWGRRYGKGASPTVPKEYIGFGFGFGATTCNSSKFITLHFPTVKYGIVSLTTILYTFPICVGVAQ